MGDGMPRRPGKGACFLEKAAVRPLGRRPPVNAQLAA
jgi:hypothetical protein